MLQISEETVLFEYEEILLGNKNNFSISFHGSKESITRSLKIIWEYAICKLLGWKIEDAVSFLTESIAKQLCLNKTYIYFDNIGCRRINFRAILHQLFPEKIRYTITNETIDEYERVLKIGQWADNPEPYKFQKNFFLDTYGIERSAIVLNYAISRSLGNLSSEELYTFFANKKSANEWLSQQKLDKLSRLLYDSHLDYLHYSISDKMKSDFLYYNEKYNQMYENTKKKNRKKKADTN